jgi:hypothetical protein
LGPVLYTGLVLSRRPRQQRGPPVDDREYPVSCISDSLLAACTALAVPVPNSVTSVAPVFPPTPDFAREVEIPASVTVVDGFCGFTALRTGRFAAGSRLRVVSGFHACDSLRGIELPPSVDKIGKTAFTACSARAAPRRQRVISGFHKCPGLKRIEIPPSLTALSSISECASLESLFFPPNARLETLDGIWDCASLKEVNIPRSLRSIMRFAFSDCSALTRVLFATDGCLKEIDGFASCEKLARIEIPASAVRCSWHAHLLKKSCSRLALVWKL